MRVQLYAKMYSSAEACGNMSTLVMGWHPFLFEPQGALLHMWRQGGFLDPRIDRCGPPISQSLPLTLSLECQGEQNSNLLCLTNSNCSAQGPIYLLAHFLPNAAYRNTLTLSGIHTCSCTCTHTSILTSNQNPHVLSQEISPIISSPRENILGMYESCHLGRRSLQPQWDLRFSERP